MTRFSMSIKQNAALTGLVVVLIFVSGCKRGFVQEPGPGKKHGQEDKREFRIYIYHPNPNQPGCLVDWPQATVWKNNHQKVRWISDDGAEYTVDFSLPGTNGSFITGVNTFHVPANGDSGALAPTAQPGYYNYGIKDANGTCKDPSNPDPGVYVK